MKKMFAVAVLTVVSSSAQAVAPFRTIALSGQTPPGVPGGKFE
jgi:hypothetical protein